MSQTSTADSADLSCYRIPGHDACYYLPDFLTEDEEEYLIRKAGWHSCTSGASRLAERCGRSKNIHSNAGNNYRTEDYSYGVANTISFEAVHLFPYVGGELTSKNVLVAQAMPPCVSTYPDIISRLRTTGAFTSSPHGAPNHIILNEYLPGQGILPHEDGPCYFPVVATLSLGSHSVFHYYKYKQETVNDSTASKTEGRSIDSTPVLSVLLEPRSVVITEHSLYSAHLHGISEITEDSIVAGDAGTPPTLADLGVPIANWDKVTGEEAIRVMSKGGVLKRATRYSLTCRDVEKVAQLKAFMKR